jgi:hypothetical protein
MTGRLNTVESFDCRGLRHAGPAGGDRICLQRLPGLPRLLDMYFPNRMQQTIFDVEGIKSDAELINQVYRLRNRDIGYSATREKESTTSEVVYHRVY